MAASTAQQIRYLGAIVAAMSRGPDTPCSRRNFDLWTSTVAAERVAATKLCAGCMIYQRCGEIATANKETSGVWGGKDRGP